MAELTVLLNGKKGRLNQVIIDEAEQLNVKAISVPRSVDPTDALRQVQAVIDFSVHHATESIVQRAAQLGIPVIVGTTGHSHEEHDRIITFAEKIPLVWCGNCSLSANLLLYLAEIAARVLDDSYQVEILELHHGLKKDSPGGTAERLRAIISDVRHLAREDAIYKRFGAVGARPSRQMGIHAMRGSSIVGEHIVYFLGQGEQLELVQRSYCRRTFAKSALKAAFWTKDKDPGLYTMLDVLDIG